MMRLDRTAQIICEFGESDAGQFCCGIVMLLALAFALGNAA
jgi:hypothetical protein